MNCGSTPRGRKSAAAPIINASDSVPPRLYPMIEFALFSPRSFGVQPSSTTPDE